VGGLEWLMDLAYCHPSENKLLSRVMDWRITVRDLSVGLRSAVIAGMLEYGRS